MVRHTVHMCRCTCECRQASIPRDSCVHSHTQSDVSAELRVHVALCTAVNIDKPAETYRSMQSALFMQECLHDRTMEQHAQVVCSWNLTGLKVQGLSNSLGDVRR